MLKFLSKKLYGTIPTVKYVSQTQKKRSKNLIYFTTEYDLINNKFFEILKKDRKHFLEDIKSTKSTLFYVPEENSSYPCTERMLVAQSPLNDLNKLRSLVGSSMSVFKQLKIKEFDIQFSPGFPLYQRKLIINNSIIAGYENLEKGKATLTDFSPKERVLEKEKGEKEKEKQESPTVINIVEDEIISNHKNDINLWINLAKGNLYTRNLANTRGSIGTPDFMHSEAESLVQKYPDKIKMTVLKGIIKVIIL